MLQIEQNNFFFFFFSIEQLLWIRNTPTEKSDIIKHNKSDNNLTTDTLNEH